MSWLKKDLALLGRTAEEEFYEALARSPDPQQRERGHTPAGSMWPATHRVLRLAAALRVPRLLPGRAPFAP